MRTLIFCVAFTASLFATDSLKASPNKASCLFLKVLGNNDTASVRSMMEEIAYTWPEANRTEATKTLIKVLSELDFAGGFIWQIAKLGEDIEEHLVILRLAKGEVGGARLLYQWSPDGLALTGIEFERRYAELVSTQVLQTPQAVHCTEGG